MAPQKSIELSRLLDRRVLDLNIARAGTTAHSVPWISSTEQASGYTQPESEVARSSLLMRPNTDHCTKHTYDITSSSNDIHQEPSDPKKVPLITSWSTGLSEDKEDIQTPASRQTTSAPWTLRRTSLLGLIACLIALVVILEVLHLLSDKNQGLLTAEQNASYLWKYLPTASKWKRLQ
jgi:hypothetical protein